VRIVGDEEIAQDLVWAASLELWRRAPAYTHSGARAQLLSIIHRSAGRSGTAKSCLWAKRSRSACLGRAGRESAALVLKLLVDDERAVIELTY
jgi:hypothetical protein